MQSPTFQQELSSPPVINGYPGVPDIPSSPTLGSQNGAIVPPPHLQSHRTLVLCFDGTGDQFDSDNSNVVQLFSMLVKDNPAQLAGIGIYTIPQIATPMMAKISKIVDMMLGNHLDAHVMGGYEFLMQNYEAGDKICIFGFSRGAYTARALAGMVHKVGLIPRCNHQQVPFAYNMYSRDDPQGWDESNAFKKAFSIDVKIEFVGICAVGLIPRRLPFTHANDSIKYFRHALSLDERRVRFKPSTSERPNEKDRCRVKHDVGQGNDVEEVWFAGCHCDVGGGSVENNTRNSLARIPLRWMIRECFKAEVGILFRQDMFKEIGMDPARLYPRVLERPDILYHSPCPPTQCSLKKRQDSKAGSNSASIYSDFVSEELEDVADAISPMYDQLQKTWKWWILEATPQTIFYQDDNDNSNVITCKINMGHGRYVPRQNRDGIKIHRSVKIRMEANCLKDGKYK
ncbi:hypothetical protein AZE42_04490 [Rhizopogon vesiculosus]|uniref:T6SS Phospholipase effector Tle1-like catalytic domain-containing protein n=1 Tax=Rhizopogon vesiculosus TaxID=180088 RepID=A0A1J8RBY6_9AGAM|nr:hypothetical protein AZE42_04490 [Rhizopogon vesiculosus]